ncbi:MAG: hypothetical protein ACI9MR_004714 [Myxococcota bacterium]|jgi:hypothetical protein
MSDEEDQDMQGEEDRSTLRGAADAVRKVFSSGFRSVASSEEWIRGVVQEAMPKELVSYIKGATDGAREEIVRIIGTQTSKFLEGLDVSGEVQKILTALSFEIKTEIRFIPNDKKVKPDIKMSIRPKRSDEAAKKPKPKPAPEPSKAETPDDA